MLGDEESNALFTVEVTFGLVSDDDGMEVFETEGIELQGLELPISRELLAPENDILADLVAVDLDRCEAETGENTVRNGGPFN